MRCAFVCVPMFGSNERERDGIHMNFETKTDMKKEEDREKV